MRNFIVVIRVDGYFEIGLGHLVRSLTIADYLSDLIGISVKFVINNKSERFFADFSNKKPYILRNADGGNAEGIELVKFLKKEKADLLLSDSYVLSKKFYTILRKDIPTVPVVAIDDYGEKADYPVMGFINFNLAADKSLYPDILPSYSFIGQSYLPLRKEFLRYRPSLGRKKTRIEEALIVMGGSDPEQQTLRFVRILKEIGQLKRINVLLGPGFRRKHEISRLIRNDERFVAHFAPGNIAILMKSADIAFSGTGVSACELFTLGVPTALLILASNQQKLADELKRHRCAYVLGYFSSLSDKKLQQEIRWLLGNPRLLDSFSKNALRTFDGKGGNRLAKAIFDLLKKYHCGSHTLLQVKNEYERSALRPQEYAKVKWGSPEGMINRFYLGIRAIKWNKVNTWLDVGSGTGAFLRELEKTKIIKRFQGIDLSPSMVKFALKQRYQTRDVKFCCQSFFDDVAGRPYDLVTCIGVLQKCAVPLEKAVGRLAELVKSGGQVFVTTKNLDWKKFQESDFIPEKGHNWFRLSEVRRAFTLAGLTITELKGFEPREKGKTCLPEQSHSICILAKKDK